MTIENMNQLKFIPHKDYTANRLVSGLLQLPNNTSLVIDETLLEQGQLDTSGTHADASWPLVALLHLARSSSGFQDKVTFNKYF